MHIDLFDEEAAALTKELHDIVESDHYPFSPRILTLRAILNKLRPEPEDGEMRTVTVRMDAADLSRQMAAMREWLDRHRYEPARFACDQDGNAVVVSVEFFNEREGEAFASHFDDQRP